MEALPLPQIEVKLSHYKNYFKTPQKQNDHLFPQKEIEVP